MDSDDGLTSDQGRLFWTGPILTAIAALALGMLAPAAAPLPTSTLLLLAIALSAALGGWRSGAATAGIAVLYLLWLFADGLAAGPDLDLRPAHLWIGALSFPAAVALGDLMHRRRGAGSPEWNGSAGGRGGLETPDEDNERFRQLVTQVEGFAIFMLDARGRNRTWNEGVERLLGYGEREWINSPAIEIFTPEDRARGEPARELHQAATEGQASDDRWLVRKDGTRFSRPASRRACAMPAAA